MVIVFCPYCGVANIFIYWEKFSEWIFCYVVKSCAGKEFPWKIYLRGRCAQKLEGHHYLSNRAGFENMPRVKKIHSRLSILETFLSLGYGLRARNGEVALVKVCQRYLLSVFDGSECFVFLVICGGSVWF